MCCLGLLYVQVAGFLSVLLMFIFPVAGTVSEWVLMEYLLNEENMGYNLKEICIYGDKFSES